MPPSLTSKLCNVSLIRAKHRRRLKRPLKPRPPGLRLKRMPRLRRKLPPLSETPSTTSMSSVTIMVQRLPLRPRNRPPLLNRRPSPPPLRANLKQPPPRRKRMSRPPPLVISRKVVMPLPTMMATVVAVEVVAVSVATASGEVVVATVAIVVTDVDVVTEVDTAATTTVVATVAPAKTKMALLWQPMINPSPATEVTTEVVAVVNAVTSEVVVETIAVTVETIAVTAVVAEAAVVADLKPPMAVRPAKKRPAKLERRATRTDKVRCE